MPSLHALDDEFEEGYVREARSRKRELWVRGGAPRLALQLCGASIVLALMGWVRSRAHAAESRIDLRRMLVYIK
jgi:hypothetical protein